MPSAKRLASIFGRRRFAMTPGTDRIRSLLTRIGNPERKFRSIHVVGTNGKGSTAAFLASILTAAGYKTGLFTSPHLVSYTERFRVDGFEIDDLLLDDLISRILVAASDADTFFELTTAIACQHFADSGVELAVVEAGMGGKADATAAIDALATVITPVSLDHSSWLGDTVAAIAAEKIAIAEPGSTVISSLQEPPVLDTIERHCRLYANRLLLAGRDYSAFMGHDTSLDYNWERLNFNGLYPGIPGSYQCWNAATAITAAKTLEDSGYSVADTAIINGIESASWPGRMQRFAIDGGIELLLDGAHNPAGSRAFAEALVVESGSASITLVLGMMEDKDIEGVLSNILPLASLVITVAPIQERALDAGRLADYCRAAGKKVICSGAVSDGITSAIKMASAGGLIAVTGSLFTVGEALAMLSGVDCDAVRG